MNSRLIFEYRRHVIYCLFVLGIITAVFILPFLLHSGAAKGLLQRTESHESDLPNYDIRSDKTAIDKIAGFRMGQAKNASQIADARDAFVRGEQALKQRVPTLRIEYNTDIRIPEVIGTDVKQGRAFLTSPSGTKHSNILIDFLKQNAELVGADEPQIDGLKIFADYTNPDGNLSFVELDQEIKGIPVFRGEVKAGFTKAGEMIRVINNLAPALDYSALSTEFGDPLAAVKAAAGLIKTDGSKLNLNKNNAASTEIKTVFGTGDWATTAEKVFFPTEPGVAVPAWRVLIWQPVNAYYVIVNADTGTMLWRKNITEDQTQSATYNVYANPFAMINVADNPFPMTPGPASPNGVQGTGISRTLVTRVGNEAPYTFNNNGWINDGVNTTDGNANEAGLDRDDVFTANGVDPNGKPGGSPNRVFNFAFTPGIPTNPAQNLGDSPLPAGSSPAVCAAAGASPAMIDYQRATVTQLFYINNRYHDEMYLLGFTEQARNFQHDNFNRGGVAGDRVSAEAQDCSGTNNANFGTPADGGRGRMQMYLWTSPTPDFDGDLDADVIIHEHTHGLSNRLHGNGSGLSLNMSRAMGEGWSDFYGHSMLSEPADAINGIYTIGAYDTYLGGPGLNNYYYGIRRFPKAIKSAVGGPLNQPHNPLTFADIDATQINLSDGAYSPRLNSGNSDQVHNAGEIWSSALWEVRAKLVTRLGWAAGNRKMLQIVTDGMKLAPIGPTFLSERDAILAAAQASSLAPEAAPDVADVWSGFALRGMGASASIQNIGTGVGDARVTEAFDLPNLYQSPNLTVSDAAGNNNGYPEPGETLTLTIPLTNLTGITATGITLQVGGGGSANYGNLLSGLTTSRDVSYTVPAGTPCGSVIELTLSVNSSLGPERFIRTFAVGQPNTTFTENFDGVTPPSIPAGWSVTSSYAPMTFVSTSSSSDSPPNSMFAADLPNCTGSGCPTTDGGGTELTSPVIHVSVPAATVSFRHKYNSEPGWDGGVLEIRSVGGAFEDIITAGGTFLQNGYNGALGVSSPNPLGGRNGWTGDSAGYVTTIVRLPATAAGQNIQFRWRFGADSNTAPVGGGWNVDSIQIVGNYICFVGPTIRSPFDFDGDGKTDLSVFRPNGANAEWWYLKSSTGGNAAAQFGASTDKLTPGDFTGDGKADFAFWRPSTGQWFVLRSEDFSFFAFPFGSTGDVPAPADYDGDGKTDAAVFRPSNSTWFISNSGGGTTIQAFGQSGDVPITADYDGDGKSDIAIYRPGPREWWLLRSTAGLIAFQFGNSGDKTVPGDYTGDGKADVAFYRPATGEWFVLRSENGSFFSFPFGATGDVPSPGDYDGDGKFDAAVFRPSTSTWFVNRSSSTVLIQPFGITGDLPVPNAFVR